ncbi:uncharacterized protein SETTUDRAFT_63163, partial [Exserohilum turcica Et28A]
IKPTFSPTYQSLITNHVLSDPSHPLHETQRRRQASRPRRGLWWHVTTGADLNKSSCVRAWARRRVRHAMREELAARGYDEGGCFVGEMKTKKKEEGLGIGKIGIANEDLKGSLRMHVLAPLVAARFEVVRGEVGSVVEALV